MLISHPYRTHHPEQKMKFKRTNGVRKPLHKHVSIRAKDTGTP